MIVALCLDNDTTVDTVTTMFTLKSSLFTLVFSPECRGFRNIDHGIGEGRTEFAEHWKSERRKAATTAGRCCGRRDRR